MRDATQAIADNFARPAVDEFHPKE